MMSTLEEQANKLRARLSPLYESPAAFWLARLEANQGRLRHAKERAAVATNPATKAFWEHAAEKAQKRINYMEKRLASAKSPSGLRPREIAERWHKAME